MDPADPVCAEETIFVASESTFKFKVMPFGLIGGSASFQRLLDLVMVGRNLQTCLVYSADILLSEVSNHMQKLRMVFEMVLLQQT